MIPADLDAVTMKLLAKNPANRYASADEAKADLQRFRHGQPVVAEPIQVPALAGAAVGAGAGALAAGVLAGDPPPAYAPGLDDDLDGGAEVEEPPRRVGVLVASLVILLAVLAGLLFLLADALFGNEVSIASEEVPTVVDSEVGEARDVLSEAGFIPILQYAENDDFPENTVFAQDPPGGTKLELGSEVILQVSSGGSTVLVPEVVGLQSTAARSVLEASHFVVVEEEDWHEVAIVGEVIRQSPAFDEDVPVGSQITIVVSQGPQPIEIPDLTGKSELEAANTLNNLGFEVAFFEEESEDIDEGRVVRTDPPAGDVLQPGSTVTVIISTGKNIPMPPVVGLTREQATNVLQGERLQPSVDIVILAPGHPDNDKVVGQAPDPGVLVPRDSIVTIQVGVAPEVPTTTTTKPPPTTTTTRPPPTTTTTTTP